MDAPYDGEDEEINVVIMVAIEIGKWSQGPGAVDHNGDEWWEEREVSWEGREAKKQREDKVDFQRGEGWSICMGMGVGRFMGFGMMCWFEERKRESLLRKPWRLN